MTESRVKQFEVMRPTSERHIQTGAQVCDERAVRSTARSFLFPEPTGWGSSWDANGAAQWRRQARMEAAAALR